MIKKILIDVRDYSYHYSKKQNVETAETEYLIKFGIGIFMYYFGILVAILTFVRHHFSIHLTMLSSIFISMIFVAIPLIALSRYLLIKIKETPIPDSLTKSEYRRKGIVTFLFFLTGLLFLISCVVFPTLMIGGKVDFS